MANEIEDIELRARLEEFDLALSKAMENPKALEEKLDALESMVAVLTQGWRGSDERDYARGTFKFIMLRMRVVFFVLRELKRQMRELETGEETANVAIIEGLLKKDPALLAKVKGTMKRKTGEETTSLKFVDEALNEYWDAIKQQITVLLPMVIKTGIENRIRKEADEKAQREMAKVKNPTYGLSEIVRAGALRRGRLEPIEQS